MSTQICDMFTFDRLICQIILSLHAKISTSEQNDKRDMKW